MREITKRDRDRLPIFGNQYKPLNVMPGTCEACVYGSVAHDWNCPVARRTRLETDAQLPTLKGLYA